MTIAIGSNLPGAQGGTPGLMCDWALARLAKLDRLRLVASSRWYRSVPVPPSAQPDYVNGIVQMEGEIEPFAILTILNTLETEAGRQRGAANAARTLDLDLIAVDAEVIDDPVLTLPHPRMAERAFVLAPMCELTPGWMHPRLHCTAAELLARCDRSGLSLV